MTNSGEPLERNMYVSTYDPYNPRITARAPLKIFTSEITRWNKKRILGKCLISLSWHTTANQTIISILGLWNLMRIFG